MSTDDKQTDHVEESTSPTFDWRTRQEAKKVTADEQADGEQTTAILEQLTERIVEGGWSVAFQHMDDAMTRLGDEDFDIQSKLNLMMVVAASTLAAGSRIIRQFAVANVAADVAKKLSRSLDWVTVDGSPESLPGLDEEVLAYNNTRSPMLYVAQRTEEGRWVDLGAGELVPRAEEPQQWQRVELPVAQASEDSEQEQVGGGEIPMTPEMLARFTQITRKNPE